MPNPEHTFFAAGNYTIKLIVSDGENEEFREKIVREGKIEYKEWDPRRSKLAAAILKGLNQIGIKEGHVVLYLGASHGYTPSYISDIIGKGGFMFALDFAPRVVRDLVYVCEQRKNMTPLLSDANQPMSYADKVTQVDVIYQDIAQRNQAGIFLDNIDYFLKPEGFGILAVKSRSIDIAKKPFQVYQDVKKELEKKVTIVDFRKLDPFEKDHCLFVVKKK